MYTLSEQSAHCQSFCLKVVPKLSSRGRDLLQRLLICNPAGRTSAADSMNHIYFSDLSPAVKNG